MRIVIDKFIKIKIDKDKLEKLLDGRDIKWLWIKVMEMGVDVKYNAFCTNIRNKVEWKLLYAYCICKVLDTNIEHLFYIE